MSSVRIEAKASENKAKEYAMYLDLYYLISSKLPERVSLPDRVVLKSDQELTELARTPAVSSKDIHATVESSLCLTTRKALADTHDVFQQKPNESKAEYAQRRMLAKKQIDAAQKSQAELLDYVLFTILSSMERPSHKLMSYPFPDSKSQHQNYTDLMKGSGNQWLWSQPNPDDIPRAPTTSAVPKPGK